MTPENGSKDASQTSATGPRSIEITSKTATEFAGTYRMPTSDGEAVVSFRLPWVKP